jgi:hypothetical protein
MAAKTKTQATTAFNRKPKKRKFFKHNIDFNLFFQFIDKISYNNHYISINYVCIYTLKYLVHHHQGVDQQIDYNGVNNDLHTLNDKVAFQLYDKRYYS